LVVIPSDLAYGSTGSGSIPPNTPIQFQIDLLGIAGK
jgi:FKBP-type peptidyl-prolyl cis-trans isomerase